MRLVLPKPLDRLVLSRRLVVVVADVVVVVVTITMTVWTMMPQRWEHVHVHMHVQVAWEFSLRPSTPDPTRHSDRRELADSEELLPQ